jgi:hypothetical protein
MRQRASRSGIALTENDAAIVKGMLARGDRQHDIAAWFGVNAGRIAEIALGKKHRTVLAALPHRLPPPGPYPCGRESTAAIDAIAAAKAAVSAAEELVRRYAH